MNARTLIQATGQSEPAPRVLSMWPLDEAGEILPEYRFAEAAVNDLKTFLPEPFEHKFEDAAAFRKYMREFRVQVHANLQFENISERLRNVMLADIAELEELQRTILQDTGAIVVELLNQAQAATSQAAGAFGEIAAEAGAWPSGLPIGVQRKAREFAEAWSMVMRRTAGRFQSAAVLYQDQLDLMQEIAQMRAQLLPRVVESFESELERQRQQIEDMKRNRGLLNQTVNNILQAMEAGLIAAGKALPEIRKAMLPLLIGAGAVLAAVVTLAVALR